MNMEARFPHSIPLSSQKIRALPIASITKTQRGTSRT